MLVESNLNKFQWRSSKSVRDDADDDSNETVWRAITLTLHLINAGGTFGFVCETGWTGCAGKSLASSTLPEKIAAEERTKGKLSGAEVGDLIWPVPRPA